MIRFEAGGVRVSVHPLMALLPLLAAALGMGVDMPATLAALALHECGHLEAARAARVRVCELRLMPFGGAMQLGNAYALSPAQILAVAAAGPAANLAGAVLAGALAQWGALSPAAAMAWTRVNLALMLFNLLPALPLDGGRMLYAAAAGPLGRDRAVGLGLWLGRAAASALLAGMVRGWVAGGRLNLSLAACAVFMLASGPEERRALADARACAPLNALKTSRRPIDMRLRAVDADYGALRALRQAAPDAATLYAVYRDGRLAGFADEQALLNAAMESPAATAGEAVPA